MLEPNNKVHDTVRDLFPRFIQGNTLLSSLTDCDVSIIPTVTSPEITLGQLTTLNQGAKPLVLVSRNDSPISKEITDHRFKNLTRETSAQNSSTTPLQSLPKVPSKVNQNSLLKWIGDASVVLDGWKAENARHSEELRLTKEELRLTKEEMNEKLREKDEELRETKEELRETKEELHKTKEELRETKEELRETKEELRETREQVRQLMSKINQKEKTVAPLHLMSLIEKYIASCEITIPETMDGQVQTLGSFLKHANSDGLEAFDDLLEKKGSILRVEHLKSEKLRAIWDKRRVIAHMPPDFFDEIQTSLEIWGLDKNPVFQAMVDHLYENGMLKGEIYDL